MNRFVPATSSILVLTAALLGLTACGKPVEPVTTATAVVAQAPQKGNNIMRFEDKKMPSAATRAGEL